MFGLLNTRWALIVPVLSSYYYVILAKTSIAGIPVDMEEAARIDGANDLTIFSESSCRCLRQSWLP